MRTKISALKNQGSSVPGWLLMIGIAVFATFLSGQITVANRHPLENVTLAILIGLLLRNLVPLPTLMNRGISQYEMALKSGIVLLGIGLSFFAVVAIGSRAITLIVLCLLIAPLLSLVGRKAGLPLKMSVLIGVGTTICGSTAIAITAPVIEAEGDDISYAVATISLFGIASMFVLPIIGRHFGLNDFKFGLWAGTAIHATPQVIAAGYMYGEIAGQVATVAKLTRNIFMAPAVFLIGLWYFQKKTDKLERLSKKARYWKAVPLFLFGFLALAIVRTVGDGTSFISTSAQWPSVIQHVGEAGKFLILVAMAGIGLNTKLSTLCRLGLKPALVGMFASVLLSIISLVLIQFLGISNFAGN